MRDLTTYRSCYPLVKGWVYKDIKLNCEHNWVQLIYVSLQNSPHLFIGPLGYYLLISHAIVITVTMTSNNENTFNGIRYSYHWTWLGSSVFIIKSLNFINKPKANLWSTYSTRMGKEVLFWVKTWKLAMLACLKIIYQVFIIRQAVLLFIY